MGSATQFFAFGFGYSAEALAARICASGGRAGGSVRSPEKVAALRAKGYSALLFQDRDAVVAAAGTATHVLISIPPDGDSDPVLAAYRDALAPLAAHWRWLGYLSTTGVYGDRGGDWVDETSPLAPQSERARRRAAAELAWTEFARENGAALHIFRLPGIYGPGRSAVEALRAGTARRIAKPGQFFSRIHVEDIASALQASMQRPQSSAIYNVCDDEPAPQADVIAFAAQLLGVAIPPLEPFEQAAKTMSAMAQSFYGESKRVSNAKLKRELGLQLLYPNYREGLRAMMATP